MGLAITDPYPFPFVNTVSANCGGGGAGRSLATNDPNAMGLRPTATVWTTVFVVPSISVAVPLLLFGRGTLTTYTLAPERSTETPKGWVVAGNVIVFTMA